MHALLPLMLVLMPLTAIKHHGPVHHPYARPHHLRTAGPGPMIVPPAKAKAQAQAAAASDAEPIEEVEAIEPEATAAPSEGDRGPAAATGQPIDPIFGVAPDPNAPILSSAGAAAALGHLHAALVHLPIAWVLLWAMVELLSFISDNKSLNSGALFLSAVTLLSFVPAALSGLCRLDELAGATKGYDTAEALLHRNIIFAAAALCAVAIFFRLINWRWPNTFCRLMCLMTVSAAAILTGYSAHLGGRMVYGADFLPF